MSVRSRGLLLSRCSILPWRHTCACRLVYCILVDCEYWFTADQMQHPALAAHLCTETPPFTVTHETPQLQYPARQPHATLNTRSAHDRYGYGSTGVFCVTVNLSHDSHPIATRCTVTVNLSNDSHTMATRCHTMYCDGKLLPSTATQ